MSRPRVTITLGHSGQVVKHAGADRSHLDRMAVSGTKRPMQERLGSNFHSSFLHGNQQLSKRQRLDGYGWDSDARSGQEDLRLKLIHKNSSQRQMVDARERINADLREKLSRTGHSSASMGINSRIPDPRTVGFVGRISSTSADDLLQMDSVRRSYSAWDMNELRRRSPDRSLIIPRGISPLANMDELRRLQSMRSDTSRPLPFTNRAPMTFQPTKPVVRLASTSVVNGPKPSCPAAEHTVASLLRSLGLSKYTILFQAEEVDMAALRQMGDSDLKELGIPMGPRKRILLALLPRTKSRLE